MLPPTLHNLYVSINGLRPEDRSTAQKQLLIELKDLYDHWVPGPGSAWTQSVLLRIAPNDSSEPTPLESAPLRLMPWPKPKDRPSSCGLCGL
jgi:hypothetical protein